MVLYKSNKYLNNKKCMKLKTYTAKKSNCSHLKIKETKYNA